jgi:hypothetical protein
MRLTTFRLQVAAAVLCAVTVRAADVVHFVVGPVNYNQPSTNTYILPLTDPGDIQIARKWVAGNLDGYYFELWGYTPWHRIRLGSDGINRDVLQPGEPLWSWHVDTFTQWGPSGFGPGWPYQDPLQLEQLVVGGEFEDNTNAAVLFSPLFPSFGNPSRSALRYPR